jgi:ABC-2 type transport system permease protein
MLRGADLTSLWPSIVVLTAMALVVFTGATLRFRRDLAPSHGKDEKPAPEHRAAVSSS